jgi:lysine 6-dehydrogenase
MRIGVLGAGLVGGPMAIDLAREPENDVCAVDINRDVLARLEKRNRIRTVQEDLSRVEAVKKVVAGFDLVISAVPGFMGFETLRGIIEAKKSVVDIAFFSEDPFALDELARRNEVTALVDCGVAPGMSNILVGHVCSQLDEVHSVTIYVGGLPEVREWPYEYRAVFSPMDVIEEYVRPARLVENGAVVVRPALSERELVDFPEVGTLEAFNTDGLRTLATTIRAANMKEKTLRYPGHVEKMAVLRDTGFFSKEEIDVGGIRIRPLDLTAKLLFPKWRMGEGDRDITVFQLIVEGKKAERQCRCTYSMLDRFDVRTGIHSMARTTGYTATQALRMLSQGLYRRWGVSAPEFVGRQPECVEFMLRGLRERGIVYRGTIEG